MSTSPATLTPIASGRPQTRAAWAFHWIRHDIIRCRFAPNARLRLEDLRERYEMGFSPLREALMRLRSEGLVVMESRKGFRVSPVSVDHLHDVTRVRIEVETLALRWSIEQGNVAWEADVLGAFHRLANHPKPAPDEPGIINEDWSREHRVFHSALVAACGSPTLMSMRTGLFDQAERYVALSIQLLDTPRDDVAEHKGLVDAALERDTARACDLCREHIERTTEKVLASRGLFDDR